MKSYPPLRVDVLESLRPLKEAFDANPELLDHKDCPYDAQTKVVLGELFKPRIIEVEKADNTGVAGEDAKKRGRKAKAGEMTDEQADEIERESTELLKELKNMKVVAGRGLDTTTKLQIIKTQTQLIDKIVNLRERFYNVRKQAEFMTTVLGLLDDVVPEDGRHEFLKRLEAYL